MKNVAFIGKMATGKSYYATLLHQELTDRGINSNILHISAKIKSIASDLFDMTGKNRDILQQIGGKMREIDKDVWITYLISEIKKGNKLPFILDDVRFEGEVTLIRQSFDLLVVRVDSDDDYRKTAYAAKYGRPPSDKELNDVTETSMEEITPDLVLTNDYTKPTAKSNIAKVLKALQV